MHDKKIKEIEQKLFNKAYKGLAKQNWQKSVNADGFCQYRGNNNCRCFVGQLIPNNFYDIRMEGYAGASPGVLNAIPELMALTVDNQIRFVDFLSYGQICHDYSDIETMQERLHELAKDFELTVPELN